MNDEDAAQLLWNEWAYRHDLFWKSLFRWGGAIIALWIVPFIRPEILSLLGKGVLLFPTIALLLSVAGAWHLGAEYVRLMAVTERYKALLGTYRPLGLPARKWWRKPFGWSIGWTTVLIFAVGLSILSFCIGGWLWLQANARAVSGQFRPEFWH